MFVSYSLNGVKLSYLSLALVILVLDNRTVQGLSMHETLSLF